MIWRWSRRDLTAWARALGARDNGELVDELARLRSRVRALQHEIASVSVEVGQAPDEELADYLDAMAAAAAVVHAILARAYRQAGDAVTARSISLRPGAVTTTTTTARAGRGLGRGVHAPARPSGAGVGS